MSSDSANNHHRKVGTYFDKASVTFDTFYDHKRSRFMQWIDKKFRSDMFERYRLTFEALEPLNDKTLIDVGCGSGPYSVEAARCGCKKVLGFDMAQGMIDLARRRAVDAGVDDRCDFLLGTFPEDSPQEIFDCAIVMGVMDYISDPSSFLSTLAQQVRGRAVLSFPSKHWFRTPVRKVRYQLKRCPLYFYEPLQIEELLKSAGFSNIKVEKIRGAGMDIVATGDRTQTS